MSKLRIHLGAHKTATTHFQNSLFASRDELAAIGTNVIPLHQSRNTYSRVVKACFRGRITLDEAKARFGQFFAEDSDGFDTVLVSDENILGQFERTLGTGQLYPEAGAYMDLARQIFDGVDTSYFLSVRSYDAFFSSLYCEAVRWEKQPEFDDLKEGMINGADWAELIDRIETSLGQRPTIFEFETYIRSQKKTLAAFSGLKTAKVQIEPRNDLRSSMSGDAVKVANAVGPAIGDIKTYRQVVLRIEAALPPDKARKKFDPWTKAQSDKLKKNYAAFRKTLP